MTSRTISHYNVTGELGRGGMGIVYKAEDTKLHRNVALKVLSPHLLSSDDDRARFYREARAAAQLNHPNIATVYAVDETVDEHGDPHPFIAMEFIEGRTLREVIDDGPLKLDDAIRIAGDIAGALNQAHEKDIVHRDVKSANVMLTEKGSVKVLDFGLAKTAQSTMLTKTGSTLGTAAYMSPEQASTGNVDRRTDLWSLGIVLYEMVAGKLPFGAHYEQAVVYSILNEDPEPLTAVRTGVPLELDRIITKCLMKDPKLRYQHGDDLVADLAAIQLGNLASRTGQHTTTNPSTRVSDQTGKGTDHGRSTWATAALIGAVGLLIGAAAVWFSMGESEIQKKEAYRLSIALPEGVRLPTGEGAPLGLNRRVLALSPNGQNLVFVGWDGSKTQLYLRQLDDFESRSMPGTDGAYGPFFSHDGRWVAFYAAGQLKKVSIEGGPPQVLGPVSLPHWGVWGPDDYIVFIDNEGSNVVRISASGGSLTSTDGPLYHWSDFLLGGHVIGTQLRANYQFEIGVQTAEEADFRGFEIAGEGPIVVGGNILLFGRSGALFAAPFGVETLKPEGLPTRIIDGVWHDDLRVQFSVAETGAIAVALGPQKYVTRLTWVDREGGKEHLPFAPHQYGAFQLSPDGSRVATSWPTSGQGEDIWILDVARSTSEQLSSDGMNYNPAWTPESDAVFSTRCKKDDCTVVSTLIGMSRRSRTIIDDPMRFSTITKDGRIGLATSARGVFSVELKEGGRVDTLLSSSASEWGPSLSPDDRYFAYTSDATQEYEIWVEPFPQTGRRWQASVGGGEEPIWSADGSELFYRYGNRLFSVKVTTTEGSISFSKPSVVYEGDFVNIFGFSYDVGPDGRFLILESVEQPDDLDHIHIISPGWMDEME